MQSVKDQGTKIHIISCSMWCSAESQFTRLLKEKKTFLGRNFFWGSHLLIVLKHVLGLCGQPFMGRWAIRVTSVRRCQKLPVCQELIPGGSKDGRAAGQVGPNRNAGNACVNRFKKGGKTKLFALMEAR